MQGPNLQYEITQQIQKAVIHEMPILRRMQLKSGPLF